MAGDVVRVTPQIEVGDEARWVYFDLVTVVFPGNVGRVTSWASGGSGTTSDQGILAWRSPPNVYVPLGASIEVTIGENDLQCGMVNLRLMYRLSSGSTTRNLVVARAVTYENLGGADG
jgi:hypothetical protein